MSITSYPRTIVKGQVANNGNANSGTGLMLWDSATNRYIAATPETFSAFASGGATAARQDTQITEAQTLNSIVSTVEKQDQQLSQFQTSTNNGILNDSINTTICTIFLSPLTPMMCKYVTIVNYATNTAPIQVSIGGGTMQLDKGYSIRLNTSNASFISVGQLTGEGSTIAYIVTS